MHYKRTVTTLGNNCKIHFKLLQSVKCWKVFDFFTINNIFACVSISKKNLKSFALNYEAFHQIEVDTVYLLLHNHITLWTLIYLNPVN